MTESSLSSPSVRPSTSNPGHRTLALRASPIDPLRRRNTEASFPPAPQANTPFSRAGDAFVAAMANGRAPAQAGRLLQVRLTPDELAETLAQARDPDLPTYVAPRLGADVIQVRDNLKLVVQAARDASDDANQPSPAAKKRARRKAAMTPPALKPAGGG